MAPEGNARLSVEQRADKICAEVENYLHKKGHYNFGFEVRFRELFVNEILAAEDAARAEASPCTKCQRAFAVLCKECFEGDKASSIREAVGEAVVNALMVWDKANKNAVQSAYEDAAKIAKGIRSCGCPDPSCAAIKTVKAIRARKEAVLSDKPSDPKGPNEVGK